MPTGASEGGLTHPVTGYVDAFVMCPNRRIKDTKSSLPPEQYVGTYADSLYGKAVVTFENGALRYRTSSKQAGTMEHWQYDTFRVTWDAAWRGSPMVTFVIGPDGKPAEVRTGGGVLRRR